MSLRGSVVAICVLVSSVRHPGASTDQTQRGDLCFRIAESLVPTQYSAMRSGRVRNPHGRWPHIDAESDTPIPANTAGVNSACRTPPVHRGKSPSVSALRSRWCLPTTPQCGVHESAGECCHGPCAGVVDCPPGISGGVSRKLPFPHCGVVGSHPLLRNAEWSSPQRRVTAVRVLV